MRLFITTLFLLTSFSAWSNEADLLTVKVERGDVLYRILSKYELTQNACNVDAFYQLNNMTKGEHILAGFSYKLPIKVYRYNGKTIRSSIGINDWDLAVAIQDYNNQLLTKGIRALSYKEDRKLYVPFHLIGCDTKVSRSKQPEVEVEAIEYVDTDIFFGSDMPIKKLSNDLHKHVYYIISGHGGPDPGAMKVKAGYQLCEDEYAYDVSLRLAKNLLQHGATVHMIIQDKNDGIRNESYLGIDKDEVCKVGGAIPLNQLSRLKQRVQAVNYLYNVEKKDKTKKIHKVIAIHVDSRTTSLKQDVFFYYAPGSKSGKKLAKTIQNTFREKYAIHQKGRGYSGSTTARNLYVLRKTNPTAVYVELANIQNVHNQKRILPASNRQVLANWLFEGLTK